MIIMIFIVDMSARVLAFELQDHQQFTLVSHLLPVQWFLGSGAVSTVKWLRSLQVARSEPFEDTLLASCCF